ncbi:MAG: DUF3795 domain-containing protein [Promethearchaeota archaeon]|jgi:hypothetical protein
MNNIIGVCGFSCSKCPAYKDNIKSEQDRKIVDEGWKKYHKTKGWVYVQPYCDGCFASEDLKPLWAGCHIRRCAIQNKVQYCGYCADFPCNRVTQLHDHMKNLSERARLIGNEDDYNKFIEPFLGKIRSEQLHNEAIDQKLIIESPPVIDAIDFPSNLNALSHNKDINRNDYEEGLKNLHKILTNILTLRRKTEGGRIFERKQVKERLKILFIIGRYGEVIKSMEGNFLKLSFDTIKENLKMGKVAIRNRLEKLKSHDINFDFSEKDSKIKLSFSNEGIGSTLPHALKYYIEFLLSKNNERKAKSLFLKADMSQYKI